MGGVGATKKNTGKMKIAKIFRIKGVGTMSPLGKSIEKWSMRKKMGKGI